MSRCILLRLALPIALAATLLPAASFAQSQDSESVADAARRAREQKKTPAKPVKVLTDDDVKPATPASTDTPAAPGTPASAASTAVKSDNAAAGVVSGNASPAPDAKDEKDSKEVADLKAQIKQAKADLDLALRELSLDQDTFYSNTDYAHDTAGKAKLDDEKQQANTKQQEVDRLLARLMELQPQQPAGATPPPKT
jgi:enamine deaminase RidA (YjgF/YER057c/UK114 family)